MPEFVAPGAYVAEFGAGPKPIEGVGTTVAGFVGRAERGPEDIREITSWPEYRRWYGDHLGVDQSFLSYAVQGFFENGGQRCRIGRVVRGSAGRAERTVGGIRIRAIGRGTWGGRVFVRFLPATGAPAPGGPRAFGSASSTSPPSARANSRSIRTTRCPRPALRATRRR